MAKIHVLAHMDKNFVRKGDKINAFKTLIGSMGNGNSATSANKMKAHLHYSISEDLTDDQIKKYVKGWKKKQVLKYYIDPRNVNFDKMFGKKMDVGVKGWDFMQWTGSLFHPGVDVNGIGTYGDQDFGWVFTSPISGTVIHEKRTWFRNGGWGNLIMIKEDEGECRHCPIHCPK